MGGDLGGDMSPRVGTQSEGDYVIQTCKGSLSAGTLRGFAHMQLSTLCSQV